MTKIKNNLIFKHKYMTVMKEKLAKYSQHPYKNLNNPPRITGRQCRQLKLSRVRQAGSPARRYDRVRCLRLCVGPRAFSLGSCQDSVAGTVPVLGVTLDLTASFTQAELTLQPLQQQAGQCGRNIQVFCTSLTFNTI